MTVLVVFLVLSFIVGGTSLGRRIRRRPLVLLGFAGFFAASFYSLRVVL